MSQVVDRQHDLDEGGQESRTLQRQGRLAQCPVDGRRCSVTVALRQPQLGEAGLRLAPDPAGFRIGGVGSLELAPQAMNLALSIRGVSECALVQDSLRKSLADANRVIQCVLVATSSRSPKRSPIATASAAAASARFEVAADDVLDDVRDQQVSALGATLALQQAIRAREPAEGRGSLPTEDQVVPDPESRAHGGQHLTSVQVSLMRSLEPVDVLEVAAEHVRGSRQQLEILRRQLAGWIRASQRLVGVRPGSSPV